jgi:serine/threonine protein kinase
MIGTTVSDYKILEKIGGGGMGVVYRAEGASLDRSFAFRFLPSRVPHSYQCRAISRSKFAQKY